MKRFDARISWERNEQAFVDRRYRRAHMWQFDGLSVPASSSPLSVPVPMSEAAAIDPEEAVVAAAASCHMLFFLSLAAARSLLVESYNDTPYGVLDHDIHGRMALIRIHLRPQIVFGGDNIPTASQIAQIHELAHESCYIANSLRSEIVIEPGR